MAQDFYVYVFRDENGEVAYVGKGSGKRFSNQQRRMARQGFPDGEIIERVDDEDEAFECEQYWIGRLAPYANKNRGGAGGRCGGRCGPFRASRPAVARYLARKGHAALRCYLTEEQVQKIYAVAQFNTTAQLEAAEHAHAQESPA